MENPSQGISSQSQRVADSARARELGSLLLADGWHASARACAERMEELRHALIHAALAGGIEPSSAWGSKLAVLSVEGWHGGANGRSVAIGSHEARGDSTALKDVSCEGQLSVLSLEVAAAHLFTRHWLGRMAPGAPDRAGEWALDAQGENPRRLVDDFEARLQRGGPLGACMLAGLERARFQNGKIAMLASSWGRALDEAVAAGLAPDPVGSQRSALSPRLEAVRSAKHGWRLIVTGIAKGASASLPGGSVAWIMDCDLGSLDDSDEKLWSSFSAAFAQSMSAKMKPGEIEIFRPSIEASILAAQSPLPGSSPRKAKAL